jgi:hypothetical protein
METKTWKFPIEDRIREFGSGPWDDEIDKMQWPDEATGLACMVRRGPLGQWCGYVGVPPGHPWFGKSYNEPDVEVHGGLTYAAMCDGDEERGICHVVDPGEPELWWLGFDCGHAFDVMPGMTDMLLLPGAVYRDLEYVKAETLQLALQVANAA